MCKRALGSHLKVSLFALLTVQTPMMRKQIMCTQTLNSSRAGAGVLLQVPVN